MSDKTINLLAIQVFILCLTFAVMDRTLSAYPYYVVGLLTAFAITFGIHLKERYKNGKA